MLGEKSPGPKAQSQEIASRCAGRKGVLAKLCDWLFPRGDTLVPRRERSVRLGNPGMHGFAAADAARRPGGIFFVARVTLSALRWACMGHCVGLCLLHCSSLPRSLPTFGRHPASVPSSRLNAVISLQCRHLASVPSSRLSAVISLQCRHLASVPSSPRKRGSILAFGIRANGSPLSRG